MKIINCIQGSPEWFAVRCGIPTSSRFAEIITSKGEPSKQREKYLYQLAGERITKCVEATYQNENMLKGKEFEDEAIKYYDLIKGVKVKRVGFCLDKKLGIGCSPDGLVRKQGLVETKCPLLSTHISYLHNYFMQAPTEYYPQLQGQLLVTGRKWVDFMSYHPQTRPLIIRVKRDEKFISILRRELKNFCAELERIIRKVR